MRLQIDKLIYGGDGLARLPADDRGSGKSAFVPFVLAGEEVEATLVEQKPGYARARLESVLRSSPDRIIPGCPYFQRCGGCHYQHASYSAQLRIKAAILNETLQRTAKLELPCELQIHASPEWNYRNRSRLKVQKVPEFAMGYRKFRSHDLLPIQQCPISSPLVNRAIQALWELGRSAPSIRSLLEIELFADHADGTLLLEAYCAPITRRSEARQLAETLQQTLAEVAGVTVFRQQPPGSPADGKALARSGAQHLSYQSGWAKYKVSAGSFFQVNRFLIDDLVKIVCANASGKLALDLYAGAGLFSTVLARSFAQVIAVESSQTSFADLVDNAPQEVKAVSATTEKFLTQSSHLQPDFVVVDPPRGGLGDGVVRGLARLGPPRITYVSCDPSTLARDVRTFVSLGYRIEGAHLIDLFPQTFHIESVIHLAR